MFTYLLFIAPALLFALWAQHKVRSTFEKYAQVPTRRGINGVEVARMLTRTADVQIDGMQTRGLSVGLTNIAGEMSDHYDPRTKTVALSETSVVNSVASVAVVAHEFGHMVGLPDEYVCMHAMTSDAMENVYAMTTGEVKTFKGSGMQIADVTQLPNGTINVPHIVRHQGAFVTLCSTAGLVPPEFGRMTPSMMSNGMVFHKHHFVTIWEAVCQASGFKDWDITLES